MAQYIYINGFPGVGKLTVAKELQKLIPNSKVYHNHLLIDPIAAAVDRGSPQYDAMRTDLRRYILNMLATSKATRDVSFIFTDSRGSTEAGRMAVKDYQDAAIKRGVPFISVILTCELEENVRRIVGPERCVGSTKLVDSEILQDIRQQERIFRFEDAEELELDTTSLSPREAAYSIREHVEKVARNGLSEVRGRGDDIEPNQVD